MCRTPRPRVVGCVTIWMVLVRKFGCQRAAQAELARDQDFDCLYNEEPGVPPLSAGEPRRFRIKLCHLIENLLCDFGLTNSMIHEPRKCTKAHRASSFTWQCTVPDVRRGPLCRVDRKPGARACIRSQRIFVVVPTKTPPRSITVKVAGLGPHARWDSEVEDGGIVLVYKRTGNFNALVPMV